MPRNNEILRTPDDPEATYAYMLRAWQDADGDFGSAGWHRIIKQAGTDLTWEAFMVCKTKPYSDLFPAELRERVRKALESDAGYADRRKAQQDDAAAAASRADRVARMRDEMRTGKRKRLNLPELDNGL